MLSEERAIELFEAELKPDHLGRCSEADCWYGVLKSELLSYTRKVEQAARAELLAGVGMEPVCEYLFGVDIYGRPCRLLDLDEAAQQRAIGKRVIPLYTADQYRAGIAAARAEQQWQPIAMAPKDGTMFLCWVSAERYSAKDGEGSGRTHDVSQVDFCWWRRGPVEMPDAGYFDPACGQIGDAQDVTHWMPLPPPPSADAIRGGGES